MSSRPGNQKQSPPGCCPTSSTLVRTRFSESIRTASARTPPPGGVFLPKDMDEILAAPKRHERATFRREASNEKQETGD
jgi:hypothetical protein